MVLEADEGGTSNFCHRGVAQERGGGESPDPAFASEHSPSCPCSEAQVLPWPFCLCLLASLPLVAILLGCADTVLCPGLFRALG